MNTIKTTIKTTISTFCLAVALGVAGAATAALDTRVEVVELGADAFRAPAHEAARFKVRPCATCELRTVRVSNATVYRVGGADAAPVALRDFRNAVTDAGDTALVYLAYDVETGIVTEIVLESGPGGTE